MIFKHTDIIRLAISNGRQLHIIRGYHGNVRKSVSFVAISFFSLTDVAFQFTHPQFFFNSEQ